MPTDKKLMTAEEVSKVLRIPKSTLYKLCHEGEIPAAKIGKHWRFDRDRVNYWLEEQFKAQQYEEQKKETDTNSSGEESEDALAGRTENTRNL